MKTKRQHLKALRNVQNNIVGYLSKDTVYREVHIPVWLFRVWGSNIKSAANFMQKELRKEKVNAAKKRRKV